MRWRRMIGLSLILAAVGVAWVGAWADTVKTRDNRTITGVVDVLGDKVRVIREDGSMVVLSKDDVVEIVRSKTALQEYAGREASIKGNDAAGRYALALWCDRQGLRPEAVRECAKALAIQPDHQGARELMLALLKAPALAATTQESRTAAQRLATAGKDLLLEEEPPWQDYFRRVVQPVLSEKCASAQCHGGPQSGRLRLLRSPVSGLPGPDVLLPNFDAIYPYVEDFDRPEKCSLLQHPLATAAGGIPSTKCKKVFSTIQDPSCQVLGNLIVHLKYPAGWKKTGDKPK